jgi:hypothetical protein
MDGAYFKKNAVKDYEAIMLTFGRFSMDPKLLDEKMTLSNNETITLQAYVGRAKKAFGLTSGALAITKIKLLAGVESLSPTEIEARNRANLSRKANQDKIVGVIPMDKNYFEQFGKDDYLAALTTNGQNVTTYDSNEPFLAENGESISPKAYMTRLAKRFDKESASAGLVQWKVLAGIEVESFTEMDKAYFEANGKNDYDECVLNSNPLNGSETRRFKANNGEMIVPSTYRRRIAKIYQLEGSQASIEKWQSLAGIEVIQYEPLNESYFKKHAKTDYEAVCTSNGGKITTDTHNKFTAQNGEELLP